MKTITWALCLGALTCGLTVSGQVVNIESQRISTDTTGWAGSAAAQFSLVQNTRRLLIANARAHVQWRPRRRHTFLMLGEYGLTQGDGSRFQDYGFGHFRFTTQVAGVWALEIFTQAQYNKANSLNFRGLAGIGPRVQMANLERLQLYAAGIIMYERERPRIGEVFEGTRLSAYVSGTWHAPGWLLTNTTYYQPLLHWWHDYRIATESRMEWTINTHLRFSIAFVYNFDARPPQGANPENYKLLTGVKFVF